MNPDILTEKLQEILQRAITVAQENHHSEVTSAHIISAMCEDDILDGIFERIHVDKQAVYQQMKNTLQSLPTVTGTDQLNLSRYASMGYQKAMDYMKKIGDTYMSCAALLIGLLQTDDPVVTKLMKDFGFTLRQVLEAENDRRGGMKMEDRNNESQLDALKKYGHDLVQDVKDGKIDPVIGRDDEIRRVIEILSRKTKENGS